MPMVTSQPARAASTADATAEAKTSGSVMTWSAANEPITASGSRRSSRAAARPMAAIESRADGSASTASVGAVELGQDGLAVRAARHHEEPVRDQRRQPVVGGLEEGARRSR